MGCCDHDSCEARSLADTSAHRRVLWAVLAVNLVIFGGEFGVGWVANSSAVQGDSLDSLGDALVYGISLLVVGRSLRARAMSALTKGGLQVAFAAVVMAEVVYRLSHGVPPVTGLMSLAAAGALVLNGLCLALLTRHRADDINMRSVWLCSRNDVMGNVGVLVTSGLIAWTGWWWLDLVFGAALAALFLQTGLSVVRAALPLVQRPIAGS
jgi:cation diffusion facilitator family transporter